MAAVVSGRIDAEAPVVLLHGGAWDIPTDEIDAHLDGMRRALRVGRRALERGRGALDTVVEVVAALEDHPAFDAGRGSVLDRDGQPQLDAGVMDGPALRWGAVANVRALANPIRAARALVETDGQERLMVGEGAERFAAEQGLLSVDPQSLVVERERRRYERLREAQGFHTSAAFAGRAVPRGTVGCVVLDADGRLAAGTSTGGAPFTRPGRVGDSPLVGSGFYADDRAAASATGWGEAIATVQLCARTCASSGGPEDAARREIDRMLRLVRWPGAGPATGGVITITHEGRGGWAFSTPRMARAWWSPAGEGAAVDRPDGLAGE